MEWDIALYIACNVYNVFPNCQSQESAFFLIIRRDVYISVIQLITAQIEIFRRYLFPVIERNIERCNNSDFGHN